MIAILINSATLALQDYSVVDANNELSSHGSTRNYFVLSLEPCFVAIFTLECMLKIFAMGLISRNGNSYLGNMWNFLDFIVVVSR